MGVLQDTQKKLLDQQEQAKLQGNKETFERLTNEVNTAYDGLLEEIEDHQAKQEKIQDEVLKHNLDKIEQEREQTEKDYIREQSGAYTDWQKQSNPYGVNAEKMASVGMTGTGYSESSQVSMYNQYQARTAAAREAFHRADLNFTNAMTEARLQNSSVLAEIAAQALQQQLELSLQRMTAVHQLELQKLQRDDAIKAQYDQKWQDVLAKIQAENALAEQKRQFEAQLAEEKRQFDVLNPPTGETPPSVKSKKMSRIEWTQKRNQYLETGIGPAEVKNYSTYEQYTMAYDHYLKGNI